MFTSIQSQFVILNNLYFYNFTRHIRRSSYIHPHDGYMTRLSVRTSTRMRRHAAFVFILPAATRARVRGCDERLSTELHGI